MVDPNQLAAVQGQAAQDLQPQYNPQASDPANWQDPNYDPLQDPNFMVNAYDPAQQQGYNPAMDPTNPSFDPNLWAPTDMNAINPAMNVSADSTLGSPNMYNTSVDANGNFMAPDLGALSAATQTDTGNQSAVTGGTDYSALNLTAHPMDAAGNPLTSGGNIDTLSLGQLSQGINMPYDVGQQGPPTGTYDLNQQSDPYAGWLGSDAGTPPVDTGAGSGLFSPIINPATGAPFTGG
jgi:hypothetical protein